MSVLIIAEAGVNHNGKLDNALKLCDIAKEAHADAVKFQTFRTNELLTRKASMADYQINSLGKSMTQYELIKELELSRDDFWKVKYHCDDIGIRFLSTPDEKSSLDFLVDEIGLDIIKVGSGEVTNIPFLRQIGKKRKKVILSTGMSTISEVGRAYEELLISGAKTVSLLHCTTSYPCPVDDVNLRAMSTLQSAFQTEVGYSDHTEGIEISIAAVTLGAKIIEKHITLDKLMKGPDHAASLNATELKLMVNSIRNIECALGDGRKMPTKNEIKIKRSIQKSVVALRNIKKGENFSQENIAVKRANGMGILAEYWDIVIGKMAHSDFEKDELISII